MHHTAHNTIHKTSRNTLRLGSLLNPSVLSLFGIKDDYGIYVQKTNTVGNYHIFCPIDKLGNVFSWEIKKLTATSVLLHPLRMGIKKAYKAVNPTTSGSFTTGYTAYTTQVGSTITLTANTTSFKFQSYTDNRGGMWSFSVDGNLVKTVSTWASVAAFQLVDIITGLDYGQHTIVATFVGEDPSHAPTGGIARGWVCLDTTNSYDFYHRKGIWIQDYTDFNILHRINDATTYDVEYESTESRILYAFFVRKQGSSVGYEWCPDHLTVSTKFNSAANKKLLADSTEIDMTTNQFSFATKHSSITLIQNHIGFNPNESAENLLSIENTLVFDYQKMLNSIKLTALQDVDCSVGYGPMIALKHSMFDNTVIRKTEYTTLLSDDSVVITKPLNYSVNTKKSISDDNLYSTEIVLGSQNIKSTFIKLTDANIHKVYSVLKENEVMLSGNSIEYSNVFLFNKITDVYATVSEKLIE